MMIKGRSRYPIAIDLTDGCVRAAQLAELREGGFAVRALYHRGLEPGGGEEADGRDEQVLAGLKEIRKDRRFRGRRAVMHIPPRSVFRFPIRFELEAQETVEEAILRESESYLSIPMEEAVVDYPSLVGPQPGEQGPYRAMILAARRDEIHRYMDLARRGGLVVEAVEFELSSLVRVHEFLYGLGSNPVVLCNTGETGTMIATVTAESILAQRYVSWSGRVLLQKVKAAFGLAGKTGRAEALLRTYGLLYEDREAWKGEAAASKDPAQEDIYRALYQVASPYIEELVNELHNIVSYVRSEEHDAPLEGVWMYGWGPGIRHLDRCLERRLGIPAHLADPASRLRFTEDAGLVERAEVSRFGLAVGLAMRRITWL